MVTVQDILSYKGNSTDIIINYSALGVTLLPIVLHLSHLPSTSFPSHVRLAWLPVSVLLVAFQLALCLQVQCVGISVVWSAYCGFFPMYYPLLALHYHGPARPLRCLILLALVVCLTALVYYATTKPPITTLAHLCALLLGAALGLAFRCYAKRFIPPYTTTAQEAAARPCHLRGTPNTEPQDNGDKKAK